MPIVLTITLEAATNAARSRNLDLNRVNPMTDASETARRMLSEKEVLKIIPVGHTTLWRMVKKGRFPKPTFVSANRCFWYEDVILAWQNEIEGQGRAALRA